MDSAEGDRRNSLTDAVLDLLQSRARQWVSWSELADVGGSCGWRTRVSQARQRAKKESADIEWNGSVKHSAYRWVPQPLGPRAEVYRAQQALF